MKKTLVALFAAALTGCYGVPYGGYGYGGYGGTVFHEHYHYGVSPYYRPYSSVHVHYHYHL